MEWGDYIEISGTENVKEWAEHIAQQLVESVEHLEGLEDRPLTIAWHVRQE